MYFTKTGIKVIGLLDLSEQIWSSKRTSSTANHWKNLFHNSALLKMKLNNQVPLFIYVLSTQCEVCADPKKLVLS